MVNIHFIVNSYIGILKLLLFSCKSEIDRILVIYIVIFVSRILMFNVLILTGAGSFEIPVLCLLVHGEPKILQVPNLPACTL